jgi:kinesin family member C1
MFALFIDFYLGIDHFKVERRSEYLKGIHNLMQELKGNIRVFWRVKPSVGSGVVQVLDRHTVVINSLQQYKFDVCFPQESTQEEIFSEVQGLVRSALDGYKVWVFAYGQTGSGKTYTMEGEDDQRGVIPRAVEEIFSEVEKMEETTVKWSFQEIYMDQIRDLIEPNNWMKEIWKAKDYAPTIKTVKTKQEVDVLLQKARKNRVVADNSMNQRSSRSHSIFQMTISYQQRSQEETKLIEGSINLIDLAGSERLHKSETPSKLILDESKAINKSLSCLKDVIQALANEEQFIPYRNSKLTYMLQPHLSSQSAKTLMIVNASPLAEHTNETINSLRFASEVNSCVL